MKTLKDLGVRAKNREVQVFFGTMFVEATKFLDRHQFPSKATLGEFCAEFGQTHPLGRTISPPEYFGELFAALVLGRARGLLREIETPSPFPPCQLAVTIDAFVSAAPFPIMKASGDNTTGMSSLVESMNAMGVADGGKDKEVGSLAAMMGAMGVTGAEGAEEEDDEDMDAEV